MLIITVLFYTFCVVIFIQLVFYGFVFGNFNRIKTTQQPSNNIPISVIICAKNESKNLKKFLPSILEQDHPNFEIVLINDCSSDDTLKVMEACKTAHTNIKIVNVKPIEAFKKKKKYA
ncbi:MAG: glycosyltransferase family 2 protein, partial [Gelidibacter sp.]|nr:glycosyltransferase family 2 protein [Gelidibacter sp.]